jgi:hypothetical protein
MRGQVMSLLAGLLLTVPLPASAEEEPPAKNPDYAHALPDLRTARWLLTPQSGDPEVRTSEDEAIHDIDVAMRAIATGAFDDHWSIDEHEQIEMAQDHIARLHQALNLLARAHAYLSKEVDDTMGIRVRNRVLENIDRANLAIRHALEPQ